MTDSRDELRRSLLIGGELHNSSTSTPHSIKRAIGRVHDLGAEVVLAAIAWERVEPQEGSFDLELIDVLVEETHAAGLRLLPLWFGAWKNGLSTYAPAWVKQDPARFPRVEISSARIDCLSPFAQALPDADSRAFATVLERLAAVSADVAMVQIENEVGVLGDSRDRSLAAEAAFMDAVPDKVITAIAGSRGRLHDAWTDAGCPESGSWARLLGPEADEAFMAYAYASHVERLAQAGRAHYAGPYLVNAWLDVVPDTPESVAQLAGAGATMAGGARPGDYPSGGPLPHVAPVWHAGAPSVAVLAADIYAGDFDVICEAFRGASGALFIPEMRRDPHGVAQMYRAVGRHRAIGVSPFGIDSFEPSDEGYAQLRDAYRQLGAVSRALAALPEAERDGFALLETGASETLVFEGIELRVSTADPFGFLQPVVPAYGCAVRTGEREFLVIGRGFALTPDIEGETSTAILSAEELDLIDGEWRVVRHLNGDEISGGAAIRFPPLRAGAQPQTTIALDERATGVVRLALYTY